MLVILVNFVILAVLCSLWVGGIFWIFLYSAVLFLILRRYLNRIKENYRVLLEEVKEMGEGNLNASADGDLGIFSAVGEELEKILVKSFGKHAVCLVEAGASITINAGPNLAGCMVMGERRK